MEQGRLADSHQFGHVLERGPLEPLGGENVGSRPDDVAAVAAVNPRTVVVVNSGSPVLMPWRNEVSAILPGWFGGQEFGAAIADVLRGAAEPGGRLPTYWPAALEDVPVLNTVPGDGKLHYSEGIHIGYRAWLKQAADRPRACHEHWFPVRPRSGAGVRGTGRIRH